MNKNFIVAIDFDGTITDEKNSRGYPFTGEVRKKAIEGIKKLKENGCKLILWTSRYGWTYKEALEICNYYNITFDAYNKNFDKIKSSKKIYADFYIDDKSSIEEIDWEKIVNHILKLKYEKEKKYNK